MGWIEEQDVGGPGAAFRGVWFKGNLFSFVQESAIGQSGVWHRDGIGPWTLTQAGIHPCYWEADGAFYVGRQGTGLQRREIYRSEDGINWMLDFTVPGAWVLNSSGAYGMEAYGDYLFCQINDAFLDTTILRRDRDGNWVEFSPGLPLELTPEGIRGVVEFGNTVYWTDDSFVRYWDGAAWIAEPTLDGQCGASAWMSIIGNILYVGAGSAYAHGGGYFWKTAAATNWSFLSLPIPDNTWSVNPLCLGGDGETYTYTESGTDLRIYRRDGSGFTLVSYETGLTLGLPGAVGVQPDGTMFFGTDIAASVRFYAFAPVYDATPEGGGLRPQAMDVDADGTALFICTYDGAGQPQLIRVPLPLSPTSMGSLIRTPGDGDGDAINIRCGQVGQQLAISGNFAAAGNKAVEVSLDGGLSWADRDPGSGNLRAQPLALGPEGVDDLTIALDDPGSQDIFESGDQGVSWTKRQENIGFDPVALERRRDELILGDGAGNILYSPNLGETLQDIDGAIAGLIAALALK